MCWVCDQADKIIAPKTVKYKKLIKFMIGKGGVNAKDCHNRTPLHHAAAFQFPDLVKMLLKKVLTLTQKLLQELNVTLSLKPH